MNALTLNLAYLNSLSLIIHQNIKLPTEWTIIKRLLSSKSNRSENNIHSHQAQKRLPLFWSYTQYTAPYSRCLTHTIHATLVYTHCGIIDRARALIHRFVERDVCVYMCSTYYMCIYENGRSAFVAAYFFSSSRGFICFSEDDLFP